MASTSQSLNQTATSFGGGGQQPEGVETTESPEAELRKENRERQARCEILKNGGHFQQPVVELYWAIRQMKTDHPSTVLCDTLEVSRSGYHAWASGDNQRRARSDDALRPKLRAVFAATRCTYLDGHRPRVVLFYSAAAGLKVDATRSTPPRGLSTGLKREASASQPVLVG